jgi:hypothetical protein
LSGTDIEEIRTFTSVIKKSGLTMHQCVEAIRMTNLLKEFEIRDDFDQYISYDSDLQTARPIEDTEATKNKTYRPHSSDFNNKNMKILSKKESTITNEISNFLGAIYQNCKTLGIEPPHIIKWIEDLFEFYLIAKKGEVINRADIQSTKHTNPISNGTAELQIPFISEVSSFIESKKNTIEKLENSRISLEENLKSLSSQREDAVANFKNIIKSKKRVISYYKWYYSLRKELLTNHGRFLENEISSFANLVNEFRHYNYDLITILNLFTSINTLQQLNDSLNVEVNIKTAAKENLELQNAQLQDQLDYSKQTMKTYNQLCNIGFGLAELKDLLGTLVEIASVRHMHLKNLMPKFLKDAKAQYDDKLGFEIKINKLREEMKELEKKVPNYMEHLQLQSVFGPILFFLSNNGVSTEDIIGMNNLVIAFKNGNFLSEGFDLKSQERSISDKNYNNIQYWSLFIEKLKTLKNIHLEIDKRTTNLDNLKAITIKLNNKRQEVETKYIEALSNFNALASLTFYMMELARQINESLSAKIAMMPRFSPIILVNINHQKNSEDNDPAGKHKKP